MTDDCVSPMPMLTYSQPVIALGGGSYDAAMIQPLLANHPLIAADSGADAARSMGIMPDYIIGDFDSISDPSQFPSDRLIPMSAQDSTDLEKTLSCLRAPLCLGFGFLGRRFDHSLAALHALARCQTPMILIGRHDAVMYCRKDFSGLLPVGERLSVWPLVRQGFLASTGLEWPLDGLLLEAGKQIGTSNRITALTNHDHQGAAQTSDHIPVSLKGAEGEGYFIMLAARNWRCLAESLSPGALSQAVS
jgi:thiamine pyrophosphokinase